jgi:hypothetical protein
MYVLLSLKVVDCCVATQLLLLSFFRVLARSKDKLALHGISLRAKKNLGSFSKGLASFDQQGFFQQGSTSLQRGKAFFSVYHGAVLQRD